MRATALHDAPVIVGAGLAGLSVALRLAPRRSIVLSLGAFGTGASTGWAQGGIAAAVGTDDGPALHLADTLAAGAGACDPHAAASIVADGADAIARLADWGACFDRHPHGVLRLGLEAAHGRRRIVHAGGDGTGRAILAALVARVRATPSIEVIEHADARRILLDDFGRVSGLAIAIEGVTRILPTRQLVIATGGLASLFARTTNPPTATGSGIALAASAGAKLRGLEFVQFHPTAIDIGCDPMPLASEALRGEGALLVDGAGERFVDELAPRDVVARAIARRIDAGSPVFLDAREALGARMHTAFPSITARCRQAGIDPATDPIPVAPAAHYTMGGIATDLSGATSIEGLFACGEAASTGLHGANRLASNSLLEAAVMGARVADACAGRIPPRRSRIGSAVAPLRPRGNARAIRPILSAGFGVLRDAGGMERAAAALLALQDAADTDQDALDVALVLAASALERRESRGAHARSDHPETGLWTPAFAPTAIQARAWLGRLPEAA